MLKITETSVVVAAAPGSYAVVFEFEDYSDKIVESQPVIVAWKIDDDATFQKVIPVFAGRKAPATFHPLEAPGHGAELVYLPDHDGRLRLFNGGHIADTLEAARAYAADISKELSNPRDHLNIGECGRALDGSPVPF